MLYGWTEVSTGSESSLSSLVSLVLVSVVSLMPPKIFPWNTVHTVTYPLWKACGGDRPQSPQSPKHSSDRPTDTFQFPNPNPNPQHIKRIELPTDELHRPKN